MSDLRGRSSTRTINHSNPTRAVLLACLLYGCAHSQAAPQREAPAPHLREAATQELVGHAARHVDEAPDPTKAERVSLGGLLAYADLHSPVLLVARSTRARAEAERTAASPSLPANPELSVAVGPRFTPSGRGVDVDVSLTQQIEIAGERGLRVAAADRSLDVAGAEIEQTRWLVHCDVHAGFHEALLQEERVRLAERVVAFQQSVLGVVERQIASGEVAPLTLRLAQAEVAQANQVLAAAQQAFLAARIRLARLSGWPVATPPTPAGAVDAPREPPTEQQLVEAARQRVPALRAATARAREAEARVELAEREIWPRPSIGVEYQHEASTADEGGADIVMGVLALPIPSFQTNQGERARARAELTVAEAEVDAITRTLLGEIAEAHSEVVAAAQRAKAYASEILPRFEENLTLLQRSFELGEIDMLELSTGRERFLKIQSDALSAQLDYFVALAGLERVVGVDLWHDDHHEEIAR